MLDMSLMFFGATKFNQNIYSWNISKCLDMEKRYKEDTILIDGKKYMNKLLLEN